MFIVEACCAERGAERRGHAVRGEAPGPAGARRPRQHAHGGGDPAGDPRGHGGGVPHRRHVQARTRHRALPLQEEGPRHGTVPITTALASSRMQVRSCRRRAVLNFR
jgi:hypothetical protein